MIFAKTAKYPMGILWVWYGYHMEQGSADIDACFIPSL